MKKTMIKVKMTLMMLMNLAVMITSNPIFVFAAGSGDASEPLIVSGTKKLVASAIALFTGLVVSFGTVVSLKTGVKWMGASAEEKPKFQKELIGDIIATVITLTIGATLTWVVGFYTTSTK